MKKTNKLYRSETDIIIAGVAGGLGDYFDLDPALLRLIFLVITLAGGSGILLYLILWIVLPSESSLNRGVATEETVKENVKEIEKKAKDMANSVSSKKEKKSENSKMSKDSDNNNSHIREPRHWFGVFLLVLGSLWLLRNMGLIDPDILWPVVLVVIGVLIIVR